MRLLFSVEADSDVWPCYDTVHETLILASCKSIKLCDSGNSTLLSVTQEDQLDDGSMMIPHATHVLSVHLMGFH